MVSRNLGGVDGELGVLDGMGIESHSGAIHSLPFNDNLHFMTRSNRDRYR